MKYIEINIDVTVNGIEPAVTELMNIGITDTVIDDPRDIVELMDKKESYEWDYIDEAVIEKENVEPKIHIYLEDTEENRAEIENIRGAMAKLKENEKQGLFGADVDFGSLEVTYTMEDDTEWKDKWKEYFKPAKVSDSIVVKPTWEEYDNSENLHIIEIDPGMAFGTGTHETTAMCIRMLEKYMKKGEQVLDVGCGSGILSIAAALLEAGDVLAVDIDPEAVRVSKENVELNHVENLVDVRYGNLAEGIDYKANVIVANLMADLVMMLAEDGAKHLKEGGYFISSGILVEKEEIVAEDLKKKGFEIVEINEDGGWCCIVAKVKQTK